MATSLVDGRPLEQHRDDGVDLARPSQAFDEQRVQLGEPAPHGGHVDRVARAGEGRQQRPQLVLEPGRQLRHVEALIGEEV